MNILNCVIFWCLLNLALLCLLFVRHVIQDWLRHIYRKPISRLDQVLREKTSPEIS